MTFIKKFIIPILTGWIGLNLITIGSCLLEVNPLTPMLGHILSTNGCYIILITFLYIIYHFTNDEK